MKYMFLSISMVLIFLSNSVFSATPHFEVRLDQIENTNVNSVGNEWYFLFDVNNNRTIIKMDTKGKKRVSNILDRQVIGQISNESDSPTIVKIDILEVDPSHHDRAFDILSIDLNADNNEESKKFIKKMTVTEGHGRYRDNETEWIIKLSVHSTYNE